jgi:hypothetical protein
MKFQTNFYLNFLKSNIENSNGLDGILTDIVR